MIMCFGSLSGGEQCCYLQRTIFFFLNSCCFLVKALPYGMNKNELLCQGSSAI